MTRFTKWPFWRNYFRSNLFCEETPFPNWLSKISILKPNEAVLNVLDEQIDRFVRKLRKLPRKTIVIFQTDNGGSSGNGCNYPYRGGKSQLDEGGTLSPTFVLPINHKFPIKQRPSLYIFQISVSGMLTIAV